MLQVHGQGFWLGHDVHLLQEASTAEQWEEPRSTRTAVHEHEGHSPGHGRCYCQTWLSSGMMTCWICNHSSRLSAWPSQIGNSMPDGISLFSLFLWQTMTFSIPAFDIIFCWDNLTAPELIPIWGYTTTIHLQWKPWWSSFYCHRL